MNDNDKTKEQLIKEAAEIRLRIAELEESESERKKAEKTLQKARDGLEMSVKERTAELESVVGLLYSEIVDRKVAEQHLTRQKEYVNNILESVTHPLYVINVSDYRVVHMNSAACYDDMPEDITCYTLSHGLNEPCDGKKHKCVIKEIKKTGKPIRVEHVHYHKSKSPRIVEVHGYPIFNGDGNITQVVEYILDITERKEVEEALRVSEERWRLLSEHSPDHIIMLDTDLNIQYINFTSPGLTAEDITGKPLYQFVAEDKQNRIKGILESVLRTKEKANYETIYRTPDGDKIYYESSVGPRLVSGKPAGLIVVARDISERKMMEEEIRKHRDRLNEMVKERTAELVSANKRLKVEINERRRAEAEAVRVSHLAALGELAAGVAHEINNPINGVINYAQIIFNKSKDGSNEKEIAGQIIKESDRIATIVHSLLFFARNSKEQKYPVQIRELISTALVLNNTQLRKDGIKLKVNIPAEIAVIIAHAQQIEQVFLNIISNARYALNQKYPGTDGDKIIEITAREITLEGCSYIQVVFYDHGTGIPADIRDKILNPFFSTKPGKDGTGLGLSISHGIISDHGGRLLVESVEGEYTKVMVDLPLK